MPDIILALLRLIFLGLIYLFVWQVARGIATHLGIHAERRRRRGTKVVIVRSDSQAGLDFTVTDATVVGRSPEADIVIDDPYASEDRKSTRLNSSHVRISYAAL